MQLSSDCENASRVNMFLHVSHDGYIVYLRLEFVVLDGKEISQNS